MSKRKIKGEVKPRYDWMFKSSVSTLQTAYFDYVDELKNYLNATFITEDGEFGIVGNLEMWKERLNKKIEVVNKNIIDVQYLW